MTRTTDARVWAAGLLLVAACAPAPQRAPDGAAEVRAAVERLDEVLAAAVRRQDTLGVVALAVDRGGVVYRGAFGTADDVHDMPIRTDAIFRIASMTKPVASVAALQLVEAGLVGLDDPVADYLPALAGARVLESLDRETGAYVLRPPATTMTVRHLLTHTAGFGYGFTSPLVRDFEPRPGDEGAGPLLFDPGTRWHYGTNTGWVGRLVEAVSGRTLEDYFRERIFAPLGMTDTAYNVPREHWSRTATVARRQPGGGLFQELREEPPIVTTFSGDGGLWSTADDYGRFLRMWLNDGALDGARVLSAASIERMGENQVGDRAAGAIVTAIPSLSNDFMPTAPDRGRFGLGFLIELDDRPGRRAAGSLSWAGLYNTYFWIDPGAGLAGVLLTQVLPFADPQVLTTLERFERAVYELAAAGGAVSSRVGDPGTGALTRR